MAVACRSFGTVEVDLFTKAKRGSFGKNLSVCLSDAVAPAMRAADCGRCLTVVPLVRIRRQRPHGRRRVAINRVAAATFQHAHAVMRRQAEIRREASRR